MVAIRGAAKILPAEGCESGSRLVDFTGLVKKNREDEVHHGLLIDGKGRATN